MRSRLERDLTSEFKNQANGACRLTLEVVFCPPHAHKHIDMIFFPYWKIQFTTTKLYPTSLLFRSHISDLGTKKQPLHRTINKLSHLAPTGLLCLEITCTFCMYQLANYIKPVSLESMVSGIPTVGSLEQSYNLFQGKSKERNHSTSLARSPLLKLRTNQLSLGNHGCLA